MKTTYASLTEVPEAFRSEYVQQSDGTYKVKLEGDVPELLEERRRLAEFRDNNIRLMKEKTELDGKKAELESRLKGFEGIDPTEHASLKQQLAELQKKTPPDIEMRIQQAVASAINPLQKEVAAEREARKTAETSLKKRDLEASLRDVGGKLKVEERAMPDFLARGLRTFGLDGVARDGEKQLYSKENVTEPLSMEEWGKTLLVDAPHLFVPSKGGGAAPGPGGPGGKRTISTTDPLELGRLAKEIAKGEIIVVPPSR